MYKRNLQILAIACGVFSVFSPANATSFSSLLAECLGNCPAYVGTEEYSPGQPTSHDTCVSSCNTMVLQSQLETLAPQGEFPGGLPPGGAPGGQFPPAGAPSGEFPPAGAPGGTYPPGGTYAPAGAPGGTYPPGETYAPAGAPGGAYPPKGPHHPKGAPLASIPSSSFRNCCHCKGGSYSLPPILDCNEFCKTQEGKSGGHLSDDCSAKSPVVNVRVRVMTPNSMR